MKSPPITILLTAIITVWCLGNPVCFAASNPSTRTVAWKNLAKIAPTFASREYEGGGDNSALVEGNDGNFYGTRNFGGNYDNGIIYRITPSGKVTTLYSFNQGGFFDVNDISALIQARDGKFYGRTYRSIFQLDLSGSAAKVTFLYDFPPGGTIAARLVQANNNNFYCVSDTNVFQVAVSGTHATALMIGSIDEGANDLSAVPTLGPDENVYITNVYGSNFLGSLWKITISGTTANLAHFYSFTTANAGSVGTVPSNLVSGRDGNLYGTTYSGGANGHGTIFRITPSGVLTILYSPTTYAIGNLVLAADGKFYAPDLVQVDLSGSTPVIASLPISHNEANFYSSSDLTPGSDGCIYGVTQGFTFNNGVSYVYRFDVSGRVPVYSSIPFSSVQSGRYAGIITDGTNFAGYAELRLKKDGGFSGEYTVGGTARMLKGVFAPDGAYINTSDDVSLHLAANGSNFFPGGYALTGTIGGLSLTANHAAYESGEIITEASVPYTFLLPAPTDASLPQGTGYGTVRVDSTGEVRLVGKLADGTSFEEGGILVGGGIGGSNLLIIGSHLRYDGTASGKTAWLVGALDFDQTVQLDGTVLTDFDGALRWMKPRQNHGFYSQAIDTNLNVMGSAFSESTFVPSFDPGAYSLILTDSSFDISDPVSFGRSSFTVEDTGATFAIRPSGSFGASYPYPLSSTKVTFGGVWFQDQSIGCGFFEGPNGSGNISLRPAP